MKLIIAGSRTINGNGKLLLSKMLDIFQSRFVVEEIVSGTASGADRCGEELGKQRSIVIKKMPADWDRYGKRAGYVRNEQMAKYADAAIIIIHMNSRGSKHMLDTMKKAGKMYLAWWISDDQLQIIKEEKSEIDTQS